MLVSKPYDLCGITQISLLQKSFKPISEQEEEMKQ